MAQRHGKDGQGITCRGTTPFTFKTVFGKVQVRRRRIEHKADGTTEVPSAHTWQTPRQVALTPGLRDLAVLEAAHRNGELPTWRAKHHLPAWKIPRTRKKVA
jgi:hypothetical protein